MLLGRLCNLRRSYCLLTITDGFNKHGPSAVKGCSKGLSTNWSFHAATGPPYSVGVSPEGVVGEVIVGGERDPRKLAQLRNYRIKADEATIAKSLQGHWLEEHIFKSLRLALQSDCEAVDPRRPEGCSG